MTEATKALRKLVTDLRSYRDQYTDEQYIPSEIARLILIVQGRIYELDEQEMTNEKS